MSWNFLTWAQDVSAKQDFFSSDEQHNLSSLIKVPSRGVLLKYV